MRALALVEVEAEGDLGWAGQRVHPLGLVDWWAGVEACWGLLSCTSLPGLLLLVHLLLKPLFLSGASP